MEEVKLSNRKYVFRKYSSSSDRSHTKGNLGLNITCNEKIRHLYKYVEINAYFMKCISCGHNFIRNFNIPKSTCQFDLDKYARDYLEYQVADITIFI